MPDGDVTPDAAPFVADLLWTTRLQFRLAHDLCVIHGRTIDIDDPEDLHDIVRIAFGVKAGELLELAVRETLVDARDVGIKSEVSGADAAVRRKLPVVGKHLLRRNVVKYALPVVRVPLNAALNYLFTVEIAHMAGEVLVEKASEPEVRESCGGDSRSHEVQVLEPHQALYVPKPGVADLRVGEEERGQFVQALQMGQTVVGDLRGVEFQDL